MKISLILSLMVVACSADEKRKYFSIEALNPGQALLFEKIGNLNLILEIRHLSFNFNITDLIESSQKTLQEQNKAIASLCDVSDGFCKEDLESLVEKVKTKYEELKDIFQVPRRKKRCLVNVFGFGNDDSEKIETDFISMRDVMQKILNVLREHHESLETIIKKTNLTTAWLMNSTVFYNKNTKKQEVSMLIARSKEKFDELDSFIKSIHRVMINKRMDTELMTVNEFQDKLNVIEKSLIGSNKKLPFYKVRDYLNKVEANHRIVGNVFTIEMEIPIVERNSRSMFKIFKVPTKLDDKLITLDVQWSFLANDSVSTVTFMSLDSCYVIKDLSRQFFCEPQSPIKLMKHDTDCLTISFSKLKLNSQECKFMISAVEFNRLTFVKKSDFQFFFFANQKSETLQIICHGKAENVTLKSQSGIINLSSGCSLITNEVKLLAIGRSDESPYWKHAILNITFDQSELSALIKEIGFFPKAETQLFPSIDDLTKFSLAKNPNNIKIWDQTYRSSFTVSYEMIVIFGLVLLLVLIYAIKAWRTSSV